MKRLLAVNEKVAVYIQDSKKPEQPVDARAYLSHLIAIRSADGLVKFLQKFPHNLSRDYDRSTLDFLLKDIPAPQGEFSHSSNTVANAADNNSVEYFDACINLNETAARHSISFMGSPHLFYSFVTIAELEDLSKRIEALLNMALLYMGLSDTSSKLFDYKKGEKDSTLLIAPQYVTEILPEAPFKSAFLYKTSWTNNRTDEEWLGEPLKVGKTNLVTSGDEFLFKSKATKKMAFREAAGILVSNALTTWLNHFGKLTYVVCDSDYGIEVRDTEVKDVALELVYVIREQLIGACPRCGRPLIAHHRNKNGELNKKHCSYSCKSQTSAAMKS